VLLLLLLGLNVLLFEPRDPGAGLAATGAAAEEFAEWSAASSELEAGTWFSDPDAVGQSLTLEPEGHAAAAGTAAADEPEATSPEAGSPADGTREPPAPAAEQPEPEGEIAESAERSPFVSEGVRGWVIKRQ
jgi:hypothetical protein